MNTYKIKLSSDRGDIISNLAPVAYLDGIDYEDVKIEQQCVYNDVFYRFSIIGSGDFSVTKVLINDEPIDSWSKRKCHFHDCFGLVKIVVLIDDEYYSTDYYTVMMLKSETNQNIVNMIDYIVDNCEDYLYEYHKMSNLQNGIKKDAHVSIDSRLSLLREIYNTYTNCFHYMKSSAQTKLINVDKVASFDKLDTIHSSTIQYIVTHPEELEVVNYNSGISINKQFYEPKNTLVRTVDYSCNIYENNVVLGFILTILNELKVMRAAVIKLKQKMPKPKEHDGYIETSYYVYKRNNVVLDRYIAHIDGIIPKFQKLFGKYSTIFGLKGDVLKNIPRYTNVFRNLMPYHQIFQKMVRWFNCGNYDLSKSNLLMSFLSVSKIYEYFGLLRINNALERLGFGLKEAKTHRYKEKRFYKNTLYNNTFVFEKENKRVVVYFQPIIYNTIDTMQYKNGINLYRNTTFSIGTKNGLWDDEQKEAKGTYYCPDYILKVVNEDGDKYFIFDAKFSTVNNVAKHQLHELIYKYLFSISTFNEKDKLSGVCFLCGKEGENGLNDIHDVSLSYNKNISPSAYFLNLTGRDIDSNDDIDEMILNCLTV